MEPLNPLEVADKISEVGLSTVIAAFYLVSSLAILFYFVKTVSGTIKTQSEVLKKIEDLLINQKNMIEDIREGMNDELLAQIKILSGYAFDAAKSEVVRSLERIKRENHVDNRAGVEKKIRLILENLHSNRNSKFDNFYYAGKRLSEYTSHTWVDKITDIMLDALYDETGYNNGRATTNISLAYEEIKVEFYKNLKK